MWGRLSSLPVEATFQSPRPSGLDACPSLGRGLESPLNWQARKPAPTRSTPIFSQLQANTVEDLRGIVPPDS